MDEPGAPAPDFATAWLDEQRRFWEAWAERAGGDDFAAAEEAWSRACETWWRQVAGAVPAPLGSQLQAALQQTRLCLALAHGLVRSRDGDQELPADPALLFTAALDAVQRDTGAGPEGSAQSEQLRAFAAFQTELAAIAGDALETVRRRLAAEGAVSPRRLYEIYAGCIEERFAARAAEDRFARRVGDLVNAQVALLAAGREQR